MVSYVDFCQGPFAELAWFGDKLLHNFVLEPLIFPLETKTIFRVKRVFFFTFVNFMNLMESLLQGGLIFFEVGSQEVFDPLRQIKNNTGRKEKSKKKLRGANPKANNQTDKETNKPKAPRTGF